MLPDGEGGTKGSFLAAASELTWKDSVGQGEGRTTGRGLLSAGTIGLMSCGKKGQAGRAGHMEAANEAGKLGWGQVRESLQ